MSLQVLIFGDEKCYFQDLFVCSGIYISIIDLITVDFGIKIGKTHS